MKYECHITIDPVVGERLRIFEWLCGEWRFKVAKLLKDTGVESDRDQFATGHGVTIDSLRRRMGYLCRALKDANFVIRRYKIEEILLDSRMGDSEGLL